jgi:HEAT repeat protein
VRLRLLLAALALAAAPSPPVRAGAAEKLSSNDPATVYQAIEEIRVAKDAQAAADLFEAALKTLHPHLAVACGEALAAIGPEAAKAVPKSAIQKAMKAKDGRVQRNLARLLGTWGDPSVDEPLAYLASGRREVEVQAEALFMCGRLRRPAGGASFPAVVEAVGAAIDGRSPSVRMAACSAAGALGLDRYTDALSDAVRKAQDVRSGQYAVWALARIGSGGDVPAFLHVLESPGAGRAAVASCLKGVADLARPEHVTDLLGATRANDKDVRDAACVALGRLAAGKAFGKTEPETGTQETPTVVDRDGVRVPVSKIAERMAALVESDKAWEVRDAAQRCLLRMGSKARETVVQRMPALVDHADDDVALTAIDLCGQFQVEQAGTALTKIAHLDQNPVRRMFAARALGSVAPEATADRFLGDLQKERKGPRARILTRALGYLAHEKAYLGLVELLKSDAHGPDVLKEVEYSLERLTGHRFGRKADRWNRWYERARTRDPFHPHIQKFDRKQNRTDAKAKTLYGLTESTEVAVESGLRWLELQQHPEGFWDGNEKGFRGVVNCEAAYTGLSLLAFLGAGYNGREGKYHETIHRAAEFLAATQHYDGGFPVASSGDDSWIFAYLVGMAVWGINEAYGLSGDDALRGPAQRGIDYLVRVQTPGAGWRYGPRYIQSDSSCTSWVLMTTKTASLLGLEVPQKSFDGIDSWLERCAFDITGQEELPEDLMTAYEQEVGVKRYFKAFTGYFELSGKEGSALQQTSMTAVGMVCRFFMGWKRSHPFMIGSANYLLDYLPQWQRGLEKGQAIAWYYYYWYYGTLAMHQMGGKYWRQWNEKIKTMLPEHQRGDPADMVGSWDPDTAVLNGGRIFSTAMAILTLETYYRFSPLLDEPPEVAAAPEPAGAGMGD